MCSFIEHMITDHGSELLKLYAEDEKLTNQAIVRLVIRAEVALNHLFRL